MAYIRCKFVGGKVAVELGSSCRLGLKGAVSGNVWRGIILVISAILVALGYRNPALILFFGSMLWSMVSVTRRNWRKLFIDRQVLKLLACRRLAEAQLVAGELATGSKLWWRFLAAYFTTAQWEAAAKLLKGHKAGNQRDYLLAIALLGLAKPEEAVKMCPPKPMENWRLLKAEIYFQQNDWQKVLGVLRVYPGKNNLEITWLKGVSYYHLGQYKLARRLLRQVVKQVGPDYGEAAEILKGAQARIK